MRRLRTTMLAIATVGLLGRGAIACASSESVVERSPEDQTDASTEASTAEAGVDGEQPDAADAAVDAPTNCTDQDWCHTALPLVPDGDGGLVKPARGLNLLDVWAAPNHEAWAVTAEGFVLHWKAGEWRVAFDAKTPLQTIWGADENEIWISGTGHYAAHGTNKGGAVLFETVDVSPDEDVLRFRSTSPTDVWAVTAHRVFRYQGANDANGKPSFTSFELPNGIEAPSKNTIKTMYRRDSNIWITAYETTDCSTNGNTCCYYDNACPTNYVTARWKGNDVANAPDPASIDAWDRIVLQSERLTDLRLGTVSSDEMHTFVARAYPGNGLWITRIAPSSSHILDAGISMDAGDYGWTLEEPPAYGSTPEDLWSSSSNDVWMIATPGIVRRWDGAKWNVAHVTLTSSPLFNSLHAIDGVVTATEHELWIVGQDIAMHQVVAQ